MTNEPEVRGILLDMDDTLIDTEVVYFASTLAAMKSLGYPDAVDTCHAMIGIPGPECELMLINSYGTGFSIPDFNRAFVAHRDELLRSGLRLKPGAFDLVEALVKAEHPRAVVTSSSRKTAERHLDLAGIGSSFDVVVTRNDVARGKPEPDLYLEAAGRLGIPPQTCIAIEDSNPGVAAAYAAGTVTLMVPDILPPTFETRRMCTAILPDLLAVAVYLRDRSILP